MPELTPLSAADKPRRLIFGIFPGLVGTEEGLSGADDYDPARIDAALTQLQPDGRPLLVRGYVLYLGDGRVEGHTPADVFRFIHGGRRLDYVLCYRATDGDLTG